MVFNIAMEYWLVLGLFSLYLYDLTRFVGFNDILFTQGFKKVFSVQLGSQQTACAKKYLYFARPLQPHQLIFQLKWQLQPRQISADTLLQLTEFDHRLKILKTLQPWILINGLLTLVLFPICLLFLHNIFVLAVLVILIYSLNLSLFLAVFRKRKVLQLNSKQSLNFILDALFCPPFALNLLKKLSLQLSPSLDALSFAQLYLNPMQLCHIQQTILEDIDELIQQADDPASEYFQQLLSMQQQLNNLKELI